MAVDVILSRLPLPTTGQNLNPVKLDHTQIKGGSVTRKSGSLESKYTYRADTLGYSERVPLNVWFNYTTQRNAFQSEVGLGGTVFTLDDATGERVPIGPFSARIIVRMPSGLLVSSGQYRQAVEAAYSLHYTTTGSNSTDLNTYAALMSGEAVW